MEGSKIKNIIIIILLLLNGFLLVPVGGRRAQNANSQGAALSSAIAILRDSGIGLEADVVPQEVELPALQAVRDLTLEQEQATALLGSEVTVQARGGEVYRYEAGRSWLQIHSTGEFLAEFEPGAIPVGEDPVRQAARWLEQLGFDAVLREQTEDRLVFEQTVNGVRVLGCQVVLRCQDGAVVGIEGGCRVPGTIRMEGPSGSGSVATALMRLYNGLNGLGDIYNRIRTIEPAYRLSVKRSEPTRLIPVWYVETDTGAYQMELQSGHVSRMGGMAVPAAQADQNDAVA